MTPTQLHELDLLIAKAMGKEEVGSAKDVQGSMICFVYHSKDDCDAPFQPTRNPADAMEVLGWLLDRRINNPVAISKTKDGILDMMAIDVRSQQAKTLPLAICLFAEKIINTDASK